MKNRLFLYLILLICIFSFGIVNANFAEDYKDEFSIDGETCEILDVFVYDISNPWFFNSQRKYTTYPVIYHCCKEDECIPVVFDGNHKTFLHDSYMKEIIDLNYIRASLHNGDISENYFQVSGLDLCTYFGFKDAKKQTLNLASGVVESGALMVGTRSAYQVSNTISTARKVGLIGKFNPTSLVAGVGCGYDNKKLNIAIENLALLNAYLNNLNDGYSQEGYVSNLTNAVSLSKYYLDEYVKSPTAMVRGSANFILNIFKGLFSFSQNPNEDLEFDKTEYQIAQDTLREISGYNFYLNNPNNERIITESNHRVTMKSQQFEEIYLSFMGQYSKVYSLKPNFIKVLWTNIFYSPNYNLTEGISCLDNLTRDKEMAEEYYSENKFNSAINKINNSNSLFNCSEEVFIREVSIKRNFDKNWVYFVILSFLLYVAIENKDFLSRKIKKLI